MLHQELGSSFSVLKKNIIEISEAPEIGLKADNVSYLSTCRNSINAIIAEKDVKDGIVLVPPFTCYAVLDPFIKSGYRVVPYRINKDLSIDVEAFSQLLDQYNPQYVLVHSYFGMNTIEGLNKYLEGDKVSSVVIEDRTHSMFSSFQLEKADFHIGSIRKWLEIPEGAFIYPIPKSLQRVSEEDSDLVNIGIKALNQKALYLENYGQVDAQEHITLFSELEEYIDEQEGIYKMSASTNGILSKVNWNYFKEKRRNNYQVLSEGIACNMHISKVFEHIEPSDVPFMFPVYVKRNRRELQQDMVKNKIFPTIIWGCPEPLVDLIDDDARNVYNEILCFPCDQRYDIEDMERICECVNEFFEGVRL